MAQFNQGFWVIMSNTGGELFREFVKGGPNEGEALAKAMIEAIEACGELSEGDTFRVVAGESEAE